MVGWEMVYNHGEGRLPGVRRWGEDGPSPQCLRAGRQGERGKGEGCYVLCAFL